MKTEDFAALPWLQRLYMIGHASWSRSYGARPDDDSHASQVVLDDLTSSAEDVDPSALAHCHTGTTYMTFLAATKWVDGGCRTIGASDKYFAAMAATGISREASGELRVPWPAFVVEIPPGLLVNENGSEFRHVVVAQFEGIRITTADGSTSASEQKAWLSVHTDEREATAEMLHSIDNGTVADLLFSSRDLTPEGGEDFQRWLNVTRGDRGILEIVRRAVAGLLFTMQHTTNFATRPFKPFHRGALRESPPPHRMIMVGRPLKMDCRAEVAATAMGHRRGAPSVQTLVRGHIKRQVVGHGRLGRKVVWIEPYWRGPENAPILARPYQVGT